jgi:phosphinothricin acetyltransferase
MVRDLVDSDIIEVTDIYNYYVKNSTATFDEDILSYDQFKNRCDVVRAIYPFLVYEEDGQILGYAYLNKFSLRTAYRFTADLSIYIRNDYLGKGIGEILYKRLEAKAINMGIRNIVSIITSSNQESIKFHTKMGFLVDGIMKNFGYKNNLWLGVYYMSKNINPFDENPKIYKYEG